MTKYSVKMLWEELYGKKEEAFDYAGQRMLKAACGNLNSAYQPTIDHIRPLSKGGKDVRENIILCHRDTNEEKADHFPHWKINDERFYVIKTKGKRNSYTIIKER